ncbi:MAG: hypothetical protein QOI63_1763, partial [Thermoplasmata archaeon]|nr:hypothetical protein [Thermoplasmata archaeon]
MHQAFQDPPQDGGRRPARPIAPVAVLAVVLCALLAGCASRPDPVPATRAATSTTGAPKPNATLPPELPARLEFSGCRQLHTFFPFPVAAFQQLGLALPKDFTYATTDPAGAVADIFVAWWFCHDGRLNHTLVPTFGPGGSMLVGVHVAVPGALANQSVDLDLVPVTWLLSSSTATGYLGQLEDIKDILETGDVTHTGTNAVGPLVQDSGQAFPSFGTLGVDTAVQAAPAASPLSVYRLWQAPNGTATGYLEIANLPGTTVGEGAATLRFLGDP